ncbi:type II secretion system protein GspI [Endozoicomonas sp. (ex Bugula neritina AB1)]|nr:type II secretion system protein GspI [Endozoicomonas sp. (ex Bugula neritina AB1)]
MVAMAVLAIAGMSLVGMVRENLGNSQYLAEKRPAYWVAENKMTDIYLEGKWPPSQWQMETEILANRTWFVRSRSVKTISDDFRVVEVEVRVDKSTGSAPLAFLQTHILKP